MIEEEDSSEAVALLQRLVDRDVWSPSNISPYHDIQIISPGTKGSVGTIHLNRSLRQLLNPMAVNHEEHYFMTGTSSLSLQVGDKVFQKVNDYDRDVCCVCHFARMLSSLCVGFQWRYRHCRTT